MNSRFLATKTFFNYFYDFAGKFHISIVQYYVRPEWAFTNPPRARVSSAALIRQRRTNARGTNGKVQMTMSTTNTTPEVLSDELAKALYYKALSDALKERVKEANKVLRAQGSKFTNKALSANGGLYVDSKGRLYRVKASTRVEFNVTKVKADAEVIDVTLEAPED